MNRSVLLFIALTTVLATLPAACGPSTAQVRTATTARYHVDGNVVLPIVVGVVKQDYKIKKIDPDERTILTVERWYMADGMYADDTRLAERTDQMPGGSIRLSFKIALVQAVGALQVEVTPVAEQHRSGYSALFPLTLADPATPGWIRGKTDALNVAIWEQLREYMVTPG